MKRIILHWTAGAYNANSTDKRAYHILIEGSGNLVRGTHAISDNVNTGDGDYAAHTKNCNTQSIGVSACAMAGAQESPFKPGSYPLTKTQWVTMAKVTADLCKKYNIPVTPQTVLGHGEVQAVLGIAQENKWDPMILPWQPELSKNQVGVMFRAEVKKHLAGSVITEAPEAEPIKVELVDSLNGRLIGDTSYVPLRPLASAFGWTIKKVRGTKAEVIINDTEQTIDIVIVESVGYIPAKKAGELSGKLVIWLPDSKTVQLK